MEAPTCHLSRSSRAPALPHTDRLRVGSEEIVFRVTSGESDGALAVLDIRFPPGGGPSALHRHDPVEVYRVQEGELALYLEDDAGAVRRTLVRSGGVVHIPSGREHTVRNESNAEALAYVVFAPGTEMERFARAAGSLATAGQMGDVLAVAARHGVEITRSMGTTESDGRSPESLYRGKSGAGRRERFWWANGEAKTLRIRS